MDSTKAQTVGSVGAGRTRAGSGAKLPEVQRGKSKVDSMDLLLGLRTPLGNLADLIISDKTARFSRR